MGFGNMGAREIGAILLVIGVVLLIPVTMVALVARWIRRRAKAERELEARVARLESDAEPPAA